MIIPENKEVLYDLINQKETVIFYFTAAWCPDCTFIKPKLPEIEEEFSDFKFVEIDRDAYIELAQEWDIFGIPSFVAYREGQEIDRLVNKARKTKEEVQKFLLELK
ncbi:MAG: thioredoxin family protein [Lactovum sp.]